MPLNLNAYPIVLADGASVSACSFTYDKEKLDECRKTHGDTHSFYRDGENILCFSPDNKYPVTGNEVTVLLSDNYWLLSFLFKDGLTRFFKSLGRSPKGFSPIELISARPTDNILSNIITGDFPFSIFTKYEIGVRILKGKHHLVIDCSTKRIVTEKCAYFLDKGFDISGRYLTQENDKGHNRLIGFVTGVKDKEITYQDRDGQSQVIDASIASLEASIDNLDDYIKFSFDNQAGELTEKIRVQLSVFNAGQNKKEKIDRLADYLKTQKISSLNGVSFELGDALDVTRDCQQFSKPVFIFNDSGEVDWAEKGFTQFGPYTKRTFDRNDPSICVICSQQHKGEIEQFVRKLLKGINGHKYFSAGLEGKFHIGTSRVEFFTVPNDSADAYKAAIESAIQKKAQDGDKWDLALVQVKDNQKSLPVDQSPYYIGRSLFFLHQIPVHNFTLELLNQYDSSLGYSLNNMALATYAKMGGVPWLLKSSPTLSHELVIGIGSAHTGGERFGPNQRIMGITTVFSGDGSYIVSNTSKAVPPSAYQSTLTSALKETLEKIRTRRNWQKGDTIRIVFHASVKKFNQDEIEAVKAVIAEYKDYNIEYAFLKISEDHGLHMFDSATAGERKGKYAPPRGKYLKISNYEMLVYLIGGTQLRQDTDGHPRGLLVSVHKDSNFTDIKYLTAQLFNFSAHSWRSYFPNPMPVTISYSDLIAHNLGWLDKVPGWNASVMIGKIGQTQWFL